MNAPLPSATLVVEWENVRLSDRDRSRRMLAALGTQVSAVHRQLREPIEMIVLYDERVVTRPALEEFVLDALGDVPAVTLRTIATRDAGYYGQKNIGARAARGDLVVFLDSDVIPEDGWLATLLGSFADSSVEVACGGTYIETSSLYAKAFAMFWFFPMRADGGPQGAENADYFYANNVAFRRALFLRYEFPDLPLMRGQCAALAEALRRDGHRILRDPRARVSHPPPNGPVHFVRRAICEGYDWAQAARLRGVSGFGAPGRFVRALRRATSRIIRHRRDVSLGWIGATAALGIAYSYYAVCALGDCLAVVAPGAVRRYFAV
jgi:glycosyltransferase involved in cell wall biosynthesis